MPQNLNGMLIDIEDDDYDFLASIAKENGMTVSEVASDIVAREVKQWKKDLETVKQLWELEAIADTDPQLRQS